MVIESHLEERARKIVEQKAAGYVDLAASNLKRIEELKVNDKMQQAYKDDLIRQYIEAAAVAGRVAEIIRKGLE